MFLSAAKQKTQLLVEFIYNVKLVNKGTYNKSAANPKKMHLLRENILSMEWKTLVESNSTLNYVRRKKTYCKRMNHVTLKSNYSAALEKINLPDV